MLRLRLSGRGLADLDFWTKSDPFLTVSRPNRKGTGLVQVQDTMYRPLRESCWYSVKCTVFGDRCACTLLSVQYLEREVQVLSAMYRK